MFDDLLEGNRRYQETFGLAGLRGRAARGVAIVTCMDSRIEPLAMLGLQPGDAKILRNAGARVTDDVLRSVVLAVHLLGVDRVCVIQHTDCAMAKYTDGELRDLVHERTGEDTSAWSFCTLDDQRSALLADVQTIRDCPLVPATVTVAGFVYDVGSGALLPQD
jgi:carbonic anhydrase